MIWATIYELHLTAVARRALRIKHATKDEMATDSSSGIGCTTYDLTGALPNKNGLPIDIVIQRGINNNNSDENLDDSSINVQEIKLSIWSELLLSFSVISNFKAICDSGVGSDTIPSIHGLRAISMAWVILGHTCIIVFKYADNMEVRKDVEREFWFQTVSNATFSVDTFFFIRLVFFGVFVKYAFFYFFVAISFLSLPIIPLLNWLILLFLFIFLIDNSGFLVSFIYFRTNAKGKLEKLSKGLNEFTAGFFHFIGLVGYRFVRLTAPYMFVLLLVEVIMKHFHHHSVFETPTLDHENCPNYWWRNILYINTLFPVEQMVSNFSPSGRGAVQNAVICF